MRKFYSLILLGLFTTQVFADNIPSYCLDNEKVAGYFSTPEYNPNDYSYTYILDYCYRYPWNWKNLGTGERLDQPLPAKVVLSAPCSVAATLTVTEDGGKVDASPDVVKSVAASTQTIDVYNLIPNRSYSWVLTNASTHEVIEQGQFTTTGHVRMLKIDGIFNVRDMGGWIGLGGNPIKYGKIIRGSRLNVNSSTEKIITAEGIEELRRIGVKAELDMRDQSNAPMEGGGARHSYLGTDIPIVNVDGAYNSRIATFADAPQSIQGIKQMIAWFKEDRPVYLHCSVGADRTGTVAYLVGALCGMSEDALAREFELTSFSGDSVDNEADRGTWEVLVRQRTGVGRLDECSSPESYRFSDMVAKIKTFPGGTYQRKVYNHLREGVNGTKISSDDLAFLIDYLTGYKILAGFNVNVDTLRMSVGQTRKITVAPYPQEAEYSAVTFRTTSKYVATVSSDGTVTATGGGKAYIVADVDGIEKYIPVFVPITESNVPNYSVLDASVNSYLTETHYSADDYSTSTIAGYLTGTGRKDRSQSITFKWMVYSNATGQRLQVSKTSGFELYDEYVKEDKDSTQTLSDLLPDQFYYYRILASFNGKTDTLVSSVFRTTGTVSFVYVKKSFNIRDLGGWTGMNGHKVKYGVLYRGSRLKGNISEGGKVFDSEDIKDLLRLGLNAELDLRSDEETTSTTSALNRNYPYSRIANAADAQGAYVTCSDAYINALSSVIGWLKKGKKVYMGSSMGAERMGTLAFLINGLLGVDEESLCKDYELSSFSGDKDAAVYKRSEGDFPAMVAAIKGLNGNTLQEKIYRYFSEGIYGLSGSATISKEDLNWFISYMLDCPESEIESSPMTRLERVVAPRITGKIYNLLGQEVENPGPGMYIMNGKKFIIR